MEHPVDFLKRKPDRDFIFHVLLPLALAAAGGLAFNKFSGDERYMQVLTLMVFGLWGACMLYTLGLLQNVAFLALGYAIVINPRKFFGMPPAFFRAQSFGEAAYPFVSFTDLCVGILFVLALFGRLPGERHRFVSLLPKWTLVGFAGYAFAVFVSWFEAPDKRRALAQIAFDLKLTALMVVLAWVFSDRERCYRYLRLLVYGMVAACVTEFGFVFLEYTGVLRLRSTILGIPFGMGVQEAMAGISSMFRVSGTYGHANYLGAAMAAMALVIWELLLASKPLLRYRLIIWGVWVAVCVVFLISLSRGAWLGLAVAGFIYFPCNLKIQGRAWLNAFLRRYAFISILGSAMLLVAFWGPLERRMRHSEPGAMETRRKLNNVSIGRIENKPFFGGGIGNHIPITRTHPFVGEVTRVTKAPMPVHHIYLYWMTEVGIVGAIFFFLIPLSLFITALRRCFKHPDDPLTPACLAFANTFIIFWITDRFSPVTRQVDCAYLYWFMMGVTAGLQNALGRDVDNPNLPNPILCRKAHPWADA